MADFWENAFKSKQEMWGLVPTNAALVAVEMFAEEGLKVLIPGIGYGRNAQLFISKGNGCNWYRNFENRYGTCGKALRKFFKNLSRIGNGTGDQFQLEMPYCNADAFQLYLNHFSEQNKDEYKILYEQLSIPNNIVFLFLPPYSPELNPAEKVGQHIKRKFTNQHFESLREISVFFADTIRKINREKKLNQYAPINTCP